ncbi:ROK family transcriptional regulator [Pseudonocardia kongjuensis]|uniref:ROK family transcriptional regulator n=1 Tax=Pseudonocardia kongjuensis TaxID=102227 RepID=A0ABP4IG61_9PSEU
MTTTSVSVPTPAGPARRVAGPADVLRTVLDHGPVARTTIGELTGLSAAAVSRQLGRLAGAGLVRDEPVPRPRGTVGRPHVPVDIDTGQHAVAGLHVAVPYATHVLMDLRGRVLAERRLPHPPDAGPDGLPARLGDDLGRFLREHAGRRRLLGVGVATGGWVDPDRATVVEHPQLGWRDVPIGGVLERRLGLPVRVESHARALARAEQLVGDLRFRARTSMVGLFVGNVVDAALATGGLVHQGPGAAAGDVRHLPVGSDVRCPCGRAGCFLATVTESAVARRAVHRGHLAEPRFADVRAALRDGAPWAVTLFAERARAIGRAGALLLDVINPEVMVITESGLADRPELLAELHTEVARYSHVCTDPERTVVAGSFRTHALAVAGGSVALHDVYHRPLP